MKEINTYRQVYQRPEDRRDYDLYDPEGLKKTLQETLECGDTKFGLASAQV